MDGRKTEGDRVQICQAAMPWALKKIKNMRLTGADLLQIPACLHIKTRMAFYQLREGTTGSLLDPFPRKMSIWELTSVICPQPFSLLTILILTLNNRETVAKKMALILHILK